MKVEKIYFQDIQEFINIQSMYLFFIKSLDNTHEQREMNLYKNSRNGNSWLESFMDFPLFRLEHNLWNSVGFFVVSEMS